MRKWVLKWLPLADVALAPLVYPSAYLLKSIRRAGVERLPRCKDAFLRAGVFPIRNQYYEPQFDYGGPRPPFSDDRPLPGIDWNVAGQLAMLSAFSCSEELAELCGTASGKPDFFLANRTFGPGDAEYWYQMIRWVKPRRVFEVGSGNSTRVAMRAIQKNREEDPAYRCKHVCIEPYEMPWLDGSGLAVLRQQVEEVGAAFFAELAANDILFIDSSHVIRPQGDVLFECLELFPRLSAGVIVHLHDIFSPKNYRKEWLEDKVVFFNEQYLVEAFLTHNPAWKIIGALNYLHHHHPDELKSAAPFLTPGDEPGSFYMQKIG